MRHERGGGWNRHLDGSVHHRSSVPPSGRTLDDAASSTCDHDDPEHRSARRHPACPSHHGHRGRRDPHQREHHHQERHRDDYPARHLYRRHHGHGWVHQDRRRRAHASTGRHRGFRRPASASCRGSDEACRPDGGLPSHPGVACAGRCLRRGRRGGSVRPRQDEGRGDERPYPATLRTGCCRAWVLQDGGSRCSATGPLPDAERRGAAPTRVPDAVRRTARTGACWAQRTQSAAWTSATAGRSELPQPPPARERARRAPRAQESQQQQQPAWAEQRVRSALRVQLTRWM